MHDIKKLKPNKHGRYKQGMINPLSCKKLYESQQNKPIIYRSSYEKIFVQWLEHSKSVTQWGSECVGIPYINILDGKTHTYYPDYMVEMNGITWMVEVKPYNQTIPPDAGLPKDGYAWTQYIRNVSKWKAAKEFCARNGFKFIVITEHTINKMA